MPENIDLTIELFKIYLRDDSEKANLAAINAITTAMNAEMGALFYDDPRYHFRFCLSGSDFPISLAKNRWDESIAKHAQENGADTFRNWAPPGIDRPVQYWMSAQLYIAENAFGFVFIGRNGQDWTTKDISSLTAITGVIGEIVLSRHLRNLESQTREKAERALEMTERRMSDFFSLSRDMIYYSDNDGIITNINKAGLALIGVPDSEDIIGSPLSKFMSNPTSYDYFLERVHDQGYVNDFEILFSVPGKDITYCTITAHEVRDEEGRTLEIQGLVKDISDRILNERELWMTNLELAEANLKLQQAQDIMVRHEKLASIGQLAAGIAHEINNPLGFLSSNHTMLDKYFQAIMDINNRLLEKGDESYRALYAEMDMEYILSEIVKVFKENEDGFSRIKRIISNLMTFSRMDNASEFQLVDINEGIENTILVAWNEIKYVAEVVRNLGDIPKVYAHGGEINQVVLNILVNAAQAIASEGRQEKGSIAISTRKLNENVIITISDDGPGMSGEVQSKLFDPFFTTKEPGKGTGLGLSISYDIIVNKHKGSIGVDSVPGQGTTFTIGLPLIRE